MINFKVELLKLLSCMDAVFKLLHVEVARKATDGKKMVQTLKWATAHLSIRLGARHKGAGRAGWGAGRRHARHGPDAQALEARAGHDVGRAMARGAATLQPGTTTRPATQYCF